MRLLVNGMYLAGTVLIAVLAYRLMPRRWLVLPEAWREGPIGELIAASLMGWLLFACYVGSEFDGRLEVEVERVQAE